MNSMKKVLRGIIIFALCFVPCTSVYAATLNPATGDTSGRYIWIVAAVAAVALIVAIISGVSSKKKSKKKK